MATPFAARALRKSQASCDVRVITCSRARSGSAFDKAIAAFASAYVDQNERDFERFTAAVASGKLAAQIGT